MADFDGHTLRGTIELKHFRTVALPAVAAFEIYAGGRVYHLQTEHGNVEEAHEYECFFAPFSRSAGWLLCSIWTWCRHTRWPHASRSAKVLPAVHAVPLSIFTAFHAADRAESRGGPAMYFQMGDELLPMSVRRRRPTTSSSRHRSVLGKLARVGRVAVPASHPRPVPDMLLCPRVPRRPPVACRRRGRALRPGRGAHEPACTHAHERPCDCPCDCPHNRARQHAGHAARRAGRRHVAERRGVLADGA